MLTFHATSETHTYRNHTNDSVARYNVVYLTRIYGYFVKGYNLLCHLKKASDSLLLKYVWTYTNFFSTIIEAISPCGCLEFKTG